MKSHLFFDSQSYTRIKDAHPSKMIEPMFFISSQQTFIEVLFRKANNKNDALTHTLF